MDIGNKYGCLAEQEKFLPFMKDFDEFCLKHHINYSVDCGTLIGLIRHHGFVPWDDDVDYLISRENLNKLIECINQSEKLELVRDLWYYRITYKDDCFRAVGVEKPAVTFFVFDRAYSNLLLHKMKVWGMLILQQTFKERPNGSVKPFAKKLRLFIGWLVGAPFPYDKKFQYYNNISANKPKTFQYVSCYGRWPQNMKYRYDKDFVEHYHRDKFEGIEVNVIDGYDEHLTNLYGDYMTPPSDNNKVTTHKSDQAWAQH